MKLSSPIVLGFASLFGSPISAYPTFRDDDGGSMSPNSVFYSLWRLDANASIPANAHAPYSTRNPISYTNTPVELPERSQVTSLVANADGTSSIRCLEITNMLNEERYHHNADGTYSTSSIVPFTTASELDSVDIVSLGGELTDLKVDGLSTLTYNVDIIALLLTATFEVKIGTVSGNASDATQAKGNGDRTANLIFTAANGDNWFHYHNDYDNSALAKSGRGPGNPISIRATSATANQVMVFNFKKTPDNKVLHEGPCGFSGVETPDDGEVKRNRWAGRSSRLQAPLGGA